MEKKYPQFKIYKTNPIQQIKKKRGFPVYYTLFILTTCAILTKLTFSCYNFFTKKYLFSSCKNEFEKIDLIIKYKNFHELNKKEKSGQTMLWQACYNNNFNLVKYLLENGASASVNDPDNYGDTPLWWASFRDNKDLVLYLIESGAKKSINTIGDNGYTPLEWAYKNNNTAMAKLLIKNGAKAGDKSLQNLELMYYACYNGNLKLVKYIVKNQITRKNPENNFLNNTFPGNNFKIKYFPSEQEIEITKNFFEQLYAACLNKDIALSSFIISSNNKKIIREENSFLITSIYLACVSENLDVIKYLIENYY